MVPLYVHFSALSMNFIVTFCSDRYETTSGGASFAIARMIWPENPVARKLPTNPSYTSRPYPLAKPNTADLDESQ